MPLPRPKKLALATVLTLTVLLTTVLLLPRLLWSDGVDYSHVVSIR